MKTIRPVLTFVMCFVFVFTTYQPASAALGSWALRMSWVNFSGNSDAWSGRMVRKLSSSQWAADISSYTANPAISITLGWTYFSATEKCGQSIKQNVQGGARSVAGTQTAKTVFVGTMTCAGTRYGSSNGKNEFKHGGVTRYDEWYQQEIIP